MKTAIITLELELYGSDEELGAAEIEAKLKELTSEFEDQCRQQSWVKDIYDSSYETPED
jgi:hypothetical protein